MPKRKKLPKIPDYEGIGVNSDNMEIQKARPLQSLAETELTLSEFKILDAYLARINSHEPNARYVRFERGELEKILGVGQLKKEDLSKRIDNLFQVITIRDERKPNNFTKISLFSLAECVQDENGLWQINLACSPEAMEYIFNIDNIGYLRYRLKNVINLTSRYSYVLFLYLLDNRFRKTWSVDLADLKTLLNCNADTYNQYYRFNDLILKKCQGEINAKTDLRFSYKPTDRKNRKYTKIQFTVESQELTDCQQAYRELPDNLSTEEEYEKWLPLYGSENLTLLAEGCNYEFNKPQMEQIFAVLLRIDIPKDPMTDDLTFGRQFYLQEKYAALNAEAAKKEQNGEKPIKSRFKYFLKMLEKDTFQPAAYKHI